MHALRLGAAAVLGFVLFQYVVVYLGGFLAAIPVPASYFTLFGRHHAEVGLALLNLGLHTLPTSVLIAGGILAISRLWPTHRPATWVPVAFGMLSCLMLWVLVLSPARMAAIGVQRQGMLEELRTAFVVPWWAASNLVAPWLGLALAAWLTSPTRHRAQSGVA